MTVSGSRLLHLTLVALALVTTGCLSRRATPPIRYYTLAVTPPEAPRLTAKVVISAVTADAGYTSTRIARRPSPYRVVYATFDRWVAAPPTMLSSVLDDYFSRVSRTDPSRRLVISARVHRLETVTHEANDYARLRLTLLAHSEGTLILERAYDERASLQGDDHEDVAAALSIALDRVLDDFTATLADRLASH